MQQWGQQTDKRYFHPPKVEASAILQLHRARSWHESLPFQAIQNSMRSRDPTPLLRESHPPQFGTDAFAVLP